MLKNNFSKPRLLVELSELQGYKQWDLEFSISTALKLFTWRNSGLAKILSLLNRDSSVVADF